MDSLTQAVLGATLAGAIAGKKCTPKVLVAGAVLGTLPDLDVLIDYGDPVLNMVNHRGFTHSLFLLIGFSLLLGLGWQRFFAPSWSVTRVCVLILSALLTHPLLDSFTAYGTQLFWPLDIAPISIASIFIIDPLYTLPLIFALIGALYYKKQAALLCTIGLVISSAYLCWGLVAKELILDKISLDTAGRTSASEGVFVTPTPFNTLLWRVVALEDNGQYKEALVSLLDEKTDIDWQYFDKGQWPLAQKSDRVQDLEDFSGGFMRYQEKDSFITATDLRLGLGLPTNLLFEYKMAKKDDQGNWEIIKPIYIKNPLPGFDYMKALWLRLFNEEPIVSLPVISENVTSELDTAHTPDLKH
jgi:inner membrane protein